MPKLRNPQTPESRPISDALYARRISVKALADHLGLATENFASQMVNGTRPVPSEHAKPIAELLGLRPEAISSSYREGLEQFGSAATVGEGEEQRPVDLAINRLENDVHAVNLVLGTILATMVAHRPAEAAELAAALRRLPPKYRDQGLAYELGQVLAAAGAKGKAKAR